MALCLGPTGSGKTLLLKKLQNVDNVDNTTSSVPTVGTNLFEIKIDNYALSVRELGGIMSPLWAKYFHNVNRVLYVIDTSNLCQISAAGVLLYTVLADPQLKHAKMLRGDLHISVKFYFDILNRTRDIEPACTYTGCQREHVTSRHLFTFGNTLWQSDFLLVLNKMDVSYRQMRNEALLMLQMRRLQSEIKQEITIIETSAVSGVGREKILDWLKK